jgi:hypothetical protein
MVSAEIAVIVLIQAHLGRGQVLYGNRSLPGA